MRFTLPKNILPPLTLSDEQRDSLVKEADTVVQELVAANESFNSQGCTLAYPDWKLVRAKDGVQVYRQRKGAMKQESTPCSPPVLQSSSQPKEDEFFRFRTFSSCSNVDISAKNDTYSSSWSGISSENIMEKMRPPGVALLALQGVMDGTIDDCMFGSVAATDEAWRLRSSHINDHLDDARILATLRAPTCTDPCQFLGVKWFVKEHPVILKGIVQQRDYLILESSGFTYDSKCERVGYVLLHSIKLRDVPELMHLGIIRGEMSFCYIYRQGGPGKIDIFCRGFYDSRGGVPSRISVSLAAEAAICCTNVVDYAVIKKLRWLMTHARKRSIEANQFNTQYCEACAKKLNTISLSRTRVPCRICFQIVCSKCRVSKKMTVHVSDNGSIQQRSVQFCLRCVRVAKQQTGWQMESILSELSTAYHSTNSSGSTLASEI
ncbi:Zinc finger, RING/FYVE/PHD-type [Plasmopara halstedii]|uniref:Zinc finger, RING/FYVE/PHD-type n=1 Tax=Plasmopara halstedii TaxID=4781 RepID=A0A0P1AQV9_PLAHL|nr:Zinc finger, RING/FYVE/PHD-type [Plasmopara halstedii]CEG43650.1 Zinc finger, RING/FYVE/PHD-type [Plasmopara halstedii]|eukprot:XP_024580019.1 Zinc finger, RING/FYVE/PHD-type [Plasmopara halstedii]